MKFCYTTYDIGKDSDFEECIQLAHAGGCAGIEFPVFRALQHPMRRR